MHLHYTGAKVQQEETSMHPQKVRHEADPGRAGLASS